MKRCTRCRETKNESEFHANVSRRDGFETTCRACRSTASRERTYGVPRGGVDQLLADQRGRCAICARELGGNYVVDHDHATGRVRGLLCGGCNLGIGHLGDDAERLRAAADYLDHGIRSTDVRFGGR